MRKYAPFLGLGAGVLVCIPLVFVTIFATGAGHGTYLPARLFFPFAMFSTFICGSITAPFVVIGLVQFPFYGLLSGISFRLGHLRASLVGIVVVHLLAVALNFIIHSESFPNLVQQPNKSPEPTAVGAVSSAVAVHVASRRWLSFLR
jgi:hypothetical protein